MPSTRTPGRRVAERAPSRLGPGLVVHLARAAWWLAMAAAVGLIAASALEVGPARGDEVAAVLVSTCYTVALAIRTGGRPLVFGGVALLLGGAAVLADLPTVRDGAAVLTAVAAGVLAVMATVPAVRFRAAVGEALLAAVIAGIGAFAVIGYRPQVELDRFDYLSLALAFLLATGLVYRLGAGLYGLGRRGLVVVLLGSVVLAGTLAYAELLRRYGAPDVVDSIVEGVRWVRANLGAVPRPIQVLVGVPALVWGTHMRARRRQGWWVSAFGVAATVSIAGLLVNPATRLAEAGLITAYSLALGLLIGYLIIRIDLAFTAPGGRRGRRAEELTALRPEPGRFQPLL
ncbi:hypothetical protein [Nocardioides donggukensis]|uniref:Uncharacterized protein n=1 Tax=Nocardioides donggukensis TaxID=2774019 RepID=A0A927K377_9ACTN|nr:hypothetical protein [Nocardioides donggukensis]MBD8868115.1 hypothetical protein [Nocardioides donggukensis]